MARTVDDCALLFEAIAPVKIGAADTHPKTLRLAIPKQLWAACDADVLSCMDAALDVFRSIGAATTKVPLKTAAYGIAASWAISYREAFEDHREWLSTRATEYTPTFYNKIAAAGDLTQTELDTARAIMRQIGSELVEALRDVDALVLPATPSPAYPFGNQQLQLENGAFTRPVSLAGLPALVLPWGFSASGLPLGMQLVGRSGDEALLFEIARRYENATSWHSVEPNFSCLPIKTSLHPIREALMEYSRLHLNPREQIAADCDEDER